MSTPLTSLWRGYRDTSLILRVTIALVLGSLVGMIGGPVVGEALAPLGELLMRLLKFIILPIVLFTLMSGINQGQAGSLGRIGRKVFLYYLLTSALAIIVGLTVAGLLSPGEGMSLDGAGSVSVPENPGLLSVVLGVVPTNIVEAFAGQNLLGIIFTAMVFGLSVAGLRQSDTHSELGERLAGLIEALNAVTLKVMSGILHVVPIGVFAIVTGTVAEQGVGTLLSLGDMVVVLYVALGVHLLVYMGLLKGFGVPLGTFFREARTPMATAFATQSSSGTLPLTLEAARRLGLPRGLYGFSLPLGATLNMDGAAIRIAISAVFAANVAGASLDWMSMLQIVVVGTLISVGTAGVPGAGIVMIATVFSQVGLPIEAVALLTAIDALVGMGCTALNVTGDLVGSALIGRSEGERIAESASEDVDALSNSRGPCA